MTREEMAKVVEGATGLIEVHGCDATGLHAAAAELRKRCDGCKHFDAPCITTEVKLCDLRGSIRIVPVDGSGWCHAWEPKP